MYLIRSTFPGGVVRDIDRFGRRVRRRLSSLSPSARLPHEVCISVNMGYQKDMVVPEGFDSYHLQCAKGVNLDQAMEVAEDNRHRKEDDVAWVLPEQAN